jgi:hypothetical protein
MATVAGAVAGSRRDRLVHACRAGPVRWPAGGTEVVVVW